MRHLIDHTDQRALSFAEAARLRAGFEHLVASQASQASQHASVDDLNRRLAAGTRPALDFGCVTCQAAVGSPCTRRYGQPMHGFHCPRLTAAADAAERSPA
ncbi:hypothetical protein [Streptomyces sp. NBC_01022]|uniref:hypothetical protein n=1 Tax=Streptomyces sp. NBC_01022 TaxID=2903723 RepID=UPI002DD889C5|nr:hypothetical protein [Streptomyces sp. NBC_01022]WRZ82681.1 hypothetical protein OG316_21660 [Streptomyces sp. NBC_01022]